MYALRHSSLQQQLTQIQQFFRWIKKGWNTAFAAVVEKVFSTRADLAAKKSLLFLLISNQYQNSSDVLCGSDRRFFYAKMAVALMRLVLVNHRAHIHVAQRRSLFHVVVRIELHRRTSAIVQAIAQIKTAAGCIDRVAVFLVRYAFVLGVGINENMVGAKVHFASSIKSFE